MAYFDEVFERIKYATDKKTQVALAEVLEIRQSSISDAKRRNSVPADWLITLFEKFGLNPVWLKNGTGPMYFTQEGQGKKIKIPALVLREQGAKYDADQAPSVVVPVLSSLQFDGGGDAQAKLNIPELFYFPSLSVILIDSSFMHPVIRRGAYVGIDTASRHLSSGELYAVRMPYEGIVVRKAFVDAENERILLRSEAQGSPEVSFPIAEAEKRVAGRVMWVFQFLG